MQSPYNNMDRPPQKNCSQALVHVTPPPTRRPPGRPTMKKVGSQEVMKRQLQCSRCKGLGHNKSTCKELLWGVAHWINCTTSCKFNSCEVAERHSKSSAVNY